LNTGRWLPISKKRVKDLVLSNKCLLKMWPFRKLILTILDNYHLKVSNCETTSIIFQKKLDFLIE
jgi:hypothetical protein